MKTCVSCIYLTQGGKLSYFPYILLNEIQTMFSQLTKRSARVLPADLVLIMRIASKSIDQRSWEETKTWRSNAGLFLTNLRSKINLFFPDDWTETERGLTLWGRTSDSKMRLVTNNSEIASLTKSECAKVDLLLLEKLTGGVEWKGIR